MHDLCGIVPWRRHIDLQVVWFSPVYLFTGLYDTKVAEKVSPTMANPNMTNMRNSVTHPHDDKKRQALGDEKNPRILRLHQRTVRQMQDECDTAISAIREASDYLPAMEPFMGNGHVGTISGAVH